MANMKSKLKNFMAADDRGMKREEQTKKLLSIIDSESPVLTTVSSRMIFSPTFPEAGP